MKIRCLFNMHQWDGCMCGACGKIRPEGHRWNGCKCEKCGWVRSEGHVWKGCFCSICGRSRHEWKDGVCMVCGTVCGHSDWDEVYSINYGQMDYDSAGRGVEDFVVTLYRCADCGMLRKESRGGFCGDSSELTAITEEDYRLYGV